MADSRLTSVSAVDTRRRGDRLLEQGNVAAALECYRKAVALDPANGESLLSLGMCLLHANAPAEAEDYVRRAATAGAAPAQTRYFLGMAQQKQGKLDEAIASFNAALALKPDADIVYGDLCIALFQAGQHDAARETARQAALANPAFADLCLLLGNLYAGAGQPDRAMACYQDRLALDPNHAQAHYLLGEAFQKQGRPHDAITHYRNALEAQPDLVEACNNLGSIQFNDLLNAGEAITWYRKALTLRPDIAEIHFNLGIVYKAQGGFEQAAACFSKAVQLKADFAQAHCGLGDLLLETGRPAEARASYRCALDVKPDYADAWYGVASSFIADHKDDEALLDYFRQALKLDPELLTARGLMVYHMLQRCDWAGLPQQARILLDAIYSVSPAGRSKLPPLAFLALPGVTAADQKQCAERWVSFEYRMFPELRSKLGFDFSRPRGDKIRIGYLSADFRQHPVAFLTAEMFELHDRSRFHVTAYSYGPNDGTPMRQRLEHAFDSFVEVGKESIETVAKRIHADGTDILVDLTGHTQESRSAIMALRPAPVQVNYLGFPGTMGADFIDYMIADRFTVPPEMRKHYTEEIVWLPDCFQANDGLRPRPPAPARQACELPATGFVFCCFNQTFKILPDVFDVWCRLLKEVPGSVLWLAATHPQAEANLRAEAQARGVDPARLVMAPLMNRDPHLGRLQCADLFLDTLPFNAGTTCSDALWMGLPVVTCAGDAFASRMAGSLLTAIGAPELITYNLDDYFRLARDLARDPARYAAVRRKIAVNRDAAPLFDTRRFVANLERAYIDMLQRRGEERNSGG
jgi:protein O-GlcNAc transferase